jgi:polysaccharide biosynthesis/export protein
MRATRFIISLLAVAIAAAGCAPVMAPMAAAPVAQVAPSAPGIDNTIYGPAPVAMRAPAPVLAGRGLASGRYIAPVVAPAAVLATPVAPLAYAQPLREGPYTLDSGDRLRVVVFGQDGLSNSYVVDVSGHIAIPLIGSVSARGLTTDELSNRISERLRQGFIREPHVAVEIEAYRPFFILGEVTQPGQYPYVADMTVETAVAIAGGFGPRAFRREVTLTRMINGQQVRMKVPVTCPIRPGDTVNVHERWF